MVFFRGNFSFGGNQFFKILGESGLGEISLSENNRENHLGEIYEKLKIKGK